MENSEEDSKQDPRQKIKSAGISPEELFLYCTYCEAQIVGVMHVLVPLESCMEQHGIYKGDIAYFPCCLDCLDDYLEGEDDERFDLPK